MYVLSLLYKLFTKSTLARLSRTLHDVQPVQLVGLHKGFSSTDPIQTAPRIIEVNRTYRLHLVLTLVDYEKASTELKLTPFCLRSSTKNTTTPT